MRASKIDFSKGPVWKCIIAQAIPLTLAQLVQLLYNVVDRIYIGHMEAGSSMALTGVGLTFPIVTLIMAFTALFGTGGVPLFSMERGAGEQEKAEKILGNSFALLLVSAVVLTVVSFLFRRPILFAFGASESSYVYADAYLKVYLCGTVFAVLTTGLNGYINAQGFPRIGMITTMMGAVVNIILDPILIFGLDMGVAGAALATVISQAVSAVWVLLFLTGKKAVVPIRLRNIRISKKITGEICALGASNFIMNGTTCVVQVVCNNTLQIYGGDVYVGIMTVTNSVREITVLPIGGIVNGGQPVISYNYGAKDYKRTKAGVNFNTVVGAVYTMLAWLLIIAFPRFWFGIFSDDLQMINAGVDMLKLYFFGFVFMAFQFAGQSTFQALGDAKHAIFFSLLRKVIIVAPLTILLPMVGFGVKGVFLAEPISNVIGGLLCYATMRRTVYRKLDGKPQPTERQEKRPAVRRVLTVVGLGLILLGILAYRLEYPYPLKWQKVSAAPVQGDMARVLRWEERQIYEQYQEVEWEERTYSARRGEVSRELLGAELAVGTAKGWDDYAQLEGKDPVRTLKATLYEIRDVKTECAVAICYEGTDICYAAVNSYYRPETLGQFAADLNLQEHVEFGPVYYEYQKRLSGRYASVRFAEIDSEKVWEMLQAAPDALNEYDQQELFAIPRRVLGIAVSIPLLGYENISLSVLEDGYVRTNILDTGKLFYVGEEHTKAFTDYVLKECLGYETIVIYREEVPE